MNRQHTPSGSEQLDILGLAGEGNTSRHDAIRADVARRLRKACAHLSDADFAILVDKIVAVQVKAERGAGKTSPA